LNSALSEKNAMPVSQTSPIPRVVLNPAEFAVLPHANRELCIPHARDGVVALSQVHPTHVAAGHFTSSIDRFGVSSSIDIFDGTQRMMAAFQLACPGEMLSIKLLHLPPTAHRLLYRPRRTPPLHDRAAETLAHDVQEAFWSHGVMSHRIPVETHIPNEMLHLRGIRDKVADTFSVCCTEWNRDITVCFRLPTRTLYRHPVQTNPIGRTVLMKDRSEALT
jgi:hypothetical protein